MTSLATSTIIAQAFRLLKLGRPSSLADDDERVATARDFYPQALDMVIEANDWSFASHITSLSETTDAEAGADARLPFIYALPNDCLTVREIIGYSASWRRDGRFLRADIAENIDLRYTRKLTNESMLTSAARHIVALQLAIMMAPTWVETLSDRDRLSDMKVRALRDAARADAQTATPAHYREGAGGEWAAEALR